MNFSSDILWSKQHVMGPLPASGAIKTTNFGAARRKYQDYLVDRVIFMIILFFVTYTLHVAFGFYLFLFEN
jgi:hypothetical protein